MIITYNERCLNENEIAQAAEWLTGVGEESPEGIRDHMEKCMICKMEVLEVVEILSQVRS